MAKSKKKTKTSTGMEDNIFFLNFIGEYVEVLGKSPMPIEEGVTVPLTLQGYLLDMDEEFYYFGDNPGEYNKVIKRSDVSYIAIVENKDTGTRILEGLPSPKDENDFN